MPDILASEVNHESTIQKRSLADLGIGFRVGFRV